MKSSSILLILTVVIISYPSTINCVSSDELFHQFYDSAALVKAVSKTLNLAKNLNRLSDNETDSVIKDLEKISSTNLNTVLIEVLGNNVSDKCVEDLYYAFENVMPIGGWGSKMIDSFGKPERGILQGNFQWLGDFNECTKVYAPPKYAQSNNTVGDYRGLYCSLEVTAHLNNMSLPISIGTCLPDSCQPSSVIQPLNISFLHTKEDIESIITDAKLICRPKFEKLTPAAIGVMFLIFTFVLLSLVGSVITAYETFAKMKVNRPIYTSGFDKLKNVNGDNIDTHYIQGDEDGAHNSEYTTNSSKNLPVWLERVNPFFNCFCVFTNGSKLLDTSHSEGQLTCLHGIRFLSLTWVILCHTYYFCIYYTRNMLDILPTVDHWSFQIIMNGFYSVDSFFLLSGFLLAYLFFEVSSKTNGKVPWLYFYIHRYVRLTPVYMIMLGFYTAIYPYVGSGPFWTPYDVDQICAKNWWRNILYISNFSDSADQCVGWSWYLANDMQFFVISPLFLITLWRWPPIGYALLALFMNATTVVTFVLSYQNELIAGLGNILLSDQPQNFMDGKWSQFFNMMYTKPYTRISPYLFGIFLAYYLYKRKQNNYGKNKLVALSFGWLISSGITLACIFGLYHRHMSNLETSLYNAFNRTCFAGGLAWVIYVCLTGQGGFVNRILSFKLFIPLSRLTYCAYLIHPIVMYGYYTSMRSTIDFSQVTLVFHFFGFLLVSYAVAFMTSVLFESPIIKLDKLVRNKLSKSQ